LQRLKVLKSRPSFKVFKPLRGRWRIPRAVHIAALVAGLIALGTVGFHIIEGWSWFESFYCTLMSVSTVGAEPENQLSKVGREFNVVVLVFGLGVVGFAITSFATWVLAAELGTQYGRRRMEKEISRLRDHFIVCGLGRVGRRVAAEIAQRRVPLVTIEKDRTRAEWALDRSIPVIVGDATSEAVLRQARIEFAQGLASAVTLDAENVYITLTARGMVPQLPIIARASEDDAETKLLRAGATTVISPYAYAGERIARMLTRPNVQHFIDLALAATTGEGLNLQIEEIRVGESSKLVNSTLRDAALRDRYGSLVLAIRHADGTIEFNPLPDRKVSAGDFLIVMGDSAKLKELETVAV
jgi:voltage-gated potassium channel